MTKKIRYTTGDGLPSEAEAMELVKEWWVSGLSKKYLNEMYGAEAVEHYREGDYGRALEIFVPEDYLAGAYGGREEACFECLYYMMADILENVWDFPSDVTIWGGESLTWLVLELEGSGVFTINSLNEMLLPDHKKH